MECIKTLVPERSGSRKIVARFRPSRQRLNTWVWIDAHNVIGLEVWIPLPVVTDVDSEPRGIKRLCQAHQRDITGGNFLAIFVSLVTYRPGRSPKGGKRSRHTSASNCRRAAANLADDASVLSCRPSHR